STMGSGVLKHFRVTFDPVRHRVRFLREGGDLIDFQPPPRFGLTFAHGRQGFVVSKVVPGSQAAKTGIRAGDVLLHINGQPASALTESALQNILRTAEDLTMKLSREGYPYLCVVREKP
ncbi:MAG: PDZ domain-containing protein, partial [Planctomycetota bacterium]